MKKEKLINNGTLNFYAPSSREKSFAAVNVPSVLVERSRHHDAVTVEAKGHVVAVSLALLLFMRLAKFVRFRAVEVA